MRPAIKYALGLSATAFASLLVVTTVIDQWQLRPLGQVLSAPAQISETDAKAGFGISDVKWVNTHGVRLLTGTTTISV